MGRRGQGEGLGRRVTGQGGAWGGDCVCGVGVGGCGQSLRTGRPRFKQVCGKLVVMEWEMADEWRWQKDINNLPASRGPCFLSGH